MLNLFRLKQIFYSVSNYAEVDTFFNLLQQQFKVNLLLTDTRESIDEITQLIQSERDIKDEKRSRQLNMLLAFLGVSGFVSFVMDFWNFSLKEIPAVSFIVLSFLFLTLSINKNK